MFPDVSLLELYEDILPFVRTLFSDVWLGFHSSLCPKYHEHNLSLK